jgi:hypothetical protein
MGVIVRIRWTPILRSKRKKIKLRPGSHVILGVLLLAPGLPVCTIADVPPKVILRPVPVNPKPAPMETLSGFMRRKGFAEPNNLAVILQSASQASIPASMIVCIEFVESSGGKHYDADTNNPLGWQNGKASFPSVPAAIRHVSQELGSGRWYAGKTLQEKLRVYNPVPYYSEKVLTCMRQFAE